jgi:hypothetical protein
MLELEAPFVLFVLRNRNVPAPDIRKWDILDAMRNVAVSLEAIMPVVIIFRMYSTT